MAKYEISLKKQIGVAIDPVLQVPIERFNGQYSIMLGGEIFANSPRKQIEIGLVVEDPKAPINFLPPANQFGKEDLEFFASEVRKQLDEINGAPSERVVFDPPTVEDIEAQNELIAASVDGESVEDESL